MTTRQLCDKELVSLALWNELDPCQRDDVMSGHMVTADIGPEFLGFVDIYRNLSLVIPEHFTVLDLGCSYAPQSWYFRNHAKYIGVDVSTQKRFFQPNTEHVHMTIREYITGPGWTLDQDTTFAICSYVPDWHDKNRDLARLSFKNVFTFYPAQAKHILTSPQKSIY